MQARLRWAGYTMGFATHLVILYVGQIAVDNWLNTLIRTNERWRLSEAWLVDSVFAIATHAGITTTNHSASTSVCDSQATDIGIDEKRSLRF